MPNFKFGQQVHGNVFSLQDRGKRNASARLRSTASCFPSESSMGTRSGPSSGGYEINRFNPAYDRLEEGSVIEDWIPRDLPGINKMLRILYTRDPIAGPAVDIMSTLPWSEFDLEGLEDKALLEFYESAAQLFGDKAQEMPSITVEYLALGRFCASLIYDEAKGYWTDFVPHDSDFLTITPIPIRGFDPKIDLMLSPGVRQFVSSMDYRDQIAKAKLPDSLIHKMRSGQPIPLDPLNTLYVRRKSAPYDFVGTSIFTRLIPLWALEKALMNATVTAARRRAGNILHLTIGLDERWEPSQQEMEDIAGLFIQADEDPVGAVVATRTGVEANEIRDSGSLWKWTDEWANFSEAKMRALGISEALLSGDSTFNNMETSRSIFTEQILTLRNHLTQMVYLRRFKTLARVHGFRRRSKAQLDHRVRINRKADNPYAEQPQRPSQPGQQNQIQLRDGEMSLENLTQEDAFDIPEEDLIIPKMHWRKSLLPEGNREYIELLQMLKEEGVPVPLRVWAARGGYDLMEALEMLDEDVKIRDRVKEWKTKTGGGDEGLGEAISETPYWDPGERFMQLEKASVRNCLSDLVQTVKTPGKSEALGDVTFVQKAIARHVDGNQRKIELASYMLMRMGITHGLPISQETLGDIAHHLVTNENISNEKRAQELNFLAQVANQDQAPASSVDLDRIEVQALRHMKSGGDLRRQIDTSIQSKALAPTASTLYSGTIT